VGENKSAAMQALHRFRMAFLSATLLAAGLALLLAINRIRSQMRPLERLSDTTRRIASGDFSADDQVERDDEFGSLGKAVNRMAGNLRHKFHMLRMLGDLDRAILNTSEMDHVVQLVLGHIHASIPCDDAGILRLDEAGGGMLALSGRSDRPGEARRADCRDAYALVAGSQAPWYWIEPGAPLPDCLRSKYTIAPPHILAFPVRIKDRVESVLLLFYRQVPEEIDDITAAGRSLTDRLAVAASNIAWEETLYHQSHYDALTDLPNRVLLRDRLEQALMRAQRDRSEFAVMLIDLDQFKQVNDSLGHSAGDTLLVECARRLRAAMRQSDTAARLGGDEFVLIIPDLVHGSAADTLDRLARKLSMLLAEPVRIAERMVAMQASIGIALYPANASSHEDLLKMEIGRAHV
jgi:diguanylate cyclase (GGDEF)-like protein